MIGIAAEAHPDEMNVIGQQAIDGADESFARGSVKHQFAEGGVEFVREPAGGSIEDGKGP